MRRRDVTPIEVLDGLPSSADLDLIRTVHGERPMARDYDVGTIMDAPHPDEHPDEHPRIT